MTTNPTLPHNSAHLSHPKYRPDIDGLRAIAVLSVVGFHAFPFWVKGGFIGVDIFFVISGFLISTIILSNLERNTFSFVEFYSRRIKRIFPALLLILIASYAFGWFTLLSDEYKQLGKHIAGGAGFVSNFLFWNENGYFDNTAETKPLLHLWSLGIEEQFYIVWPLLLWLAWKQRLNLLTITIVAVIISFALNIGKVRSDAVAAFYSPQTRFWELLAGSVLAYFMLHKQNVCFKFKQRLDSWLGSIVYAQAPEPNGNTLRNSQSVLGIALIVIAVLVITKENRFPGWWAALPVAGAVLIISAGAQAWLNRAVLSNRVLGWFGLISFPLYLWHWTLLSFARIIQGETPSRGIRITAVIVSISLAWLTYKLIKKPIRFGKQSKAKTIALCVLMLVVGYVGHNSFKRDGLGFRLNGLKKSHLSASLMQFENYEKSDIFSEIYSNAAPIKERDFLLYNSKLKDPIDVAVVGDSHANRLYLGLSKNTGHSVLNIGRGTCPPFLNVDVQNLSSSESISCQPLTNNYLTYVKNNKQIKIIILNAFYNQYNRDAILVSNGRRIELGEALTQTIGFLSGSGKTIIVSLDVPEVPIACYLQGKKKDIPIWGTHQKNIKVCTIDKQIQLTKNREMIEAVAIMQAKQKNIRIYDPSSVLCAEEVCGEIDRENYLYVSDGNHLNEFGIQTVGRDLAILVKSILSNPPMAQ